MVQADPNFDQWYVRSSYQAFVQQQLRETHTFATRTRAIGPPAFLKDLEARLGQPVVLRSRGRPRTRTLASLSEK